MRTAIYIGRRFLLLGPQLLLISVGTFILVRMLPGDPARLQLGPLASEEGVQALREQQALDEPIFDQYFSYLGRLFDGDLGRSWVNSTSVVDDLSSRIPATLELIGLGMLLAVVVLVPLGAITATRGGGRPTRFLKKASFGYGLLAGALPDFWLGLLFIYFFFTLLGIAPGPEGRLGLGDVPPDQITGAYTVDSLLTGNFQAFWSAVSHLALPVTTLAFVYGAPIYKMTRAQMEVALDSDYTLFAEAYGLPRRTVLAFALRNAAPPVIVIAGVISGFLLGGAVLIEVVFNLNGLGQYAVESVESADYAPIQAFVLFAGVFTMLVYLAVDLVRYAIDPRVRARPT